MASDETRYWPWMTIAVFTANVGIFLGIGIPQSLDAIAATDPGFSERMQQLTDIVGTIPFVPATLSSYDLILGQYGFRPAQPELLSVFTSMFLHIGALHLLVNMVYLVVFGHNVERRMGRLGFLGAYLICGIAATLGFAIAQLSSNIPIVGSAGAISGILGIHFVVHGSSAQKVFTGQRPEWIGDYDMTWVRASRALIVVYVVADILWPLLSPVERIVSPGAHLAGFAGGVIFGLWLLRYEQHFDEDSPDAQDIARVDFGRARVEAAREFAEKGMLADAWTEYDAAIDNGEDPKWREIAQQEQDALPLSEALRAELKGRGHDPDE